MLPTSSLRRRASTSDLHKTVIKVDEAAAAMKQIAKSGKKILFVATKKQAKEAVAERVKAVACLRHRALVWWTLTNFAHPQGGRKMSTIDKMEKDGTLATMSSASACRSAVSAPSSKRTSVRFLI